VYDVGVACRN